MFQFPIVPLTRAQLQQEGIDGNKRFQIQLIIQKFYHQILTTARTGQTEYFFQQPMKIGITVSQGGFRHQSHSAFITHQDIIEELIKLFPDVTISSLEQKAAAGRVYQQEGILINWN